MINPNLITSADILQGYRVVKYLGLVKGFPKMVSFGFSSYYTKAWQEAMDPLVEAANQVGANAIIAVRFDIFHASEANCFPIAYGTAVVVEPIAAS